MPIIIKRYQNRKLYNTQSKQYITLEQIEKLIKGQEEVRVIENNTGEDITGTTLSQIIFELEKNRSSFLPVDLLFTLVQSSGHRIEEIRQSIFNSMNLTHHFDVEIERRINQLIDEGELTQEMGMQILKKLLAVNFRRDELIENIEGRIEEFLNQRQIPSKSDLLTLIQKIDKLTKRVDDINLNEIK